MFAGIVECVGRVASIDAPARVADGPLAARLSILQPGFFDDSPPGASVAVNGVCLTLVSQKSAAADFHVVLETLRRTNLGRLRPGDGVNLERSLRAGDRIDGHFVQGHVDALGRVARVEKRAGEWKLWVSVDADAAQYVIAKGSVALSGASLTVVDARPAEFSVVLIPTTLERTTLGRLKPGDEVNVETDVITRTVVATLQRLEGAADASLRRRLAESGFHP